MGIGRGSRQPVALLVSRASSRAPGDSGKQCQPGHGRRHRDDNRASIRTPTERRCPRCRDAIRLFL